MFSRVTFYDQTMTINPAIFKAYDIRGIYPTEINEEIYEKIIRGIYSFFIRDLKKERLAVILGRDMRVSSPSLFEVAKKALVASGATVIDVGLVSTPSFYFAVLEYGYDIGIMITASHNPKEYAGSKFVSRKGNKIIKIGKNTGMDTVAQNVLTDSFVPYSNDGKIIKKTNVLDDEIDKALSEIDQTKIKPFTVVSDPANGMGSLYIGRLFEKIPGNLIKMNFDLDGTFPAHPADPLDFENLKPLQDRVIAEKADLGIEPDGDGDRVFFINEKGEVVPATFISALIAKEVLEKQSGQTIISDIRYTQNVKNIVEKNNGTFEVSKVGHAFITEDVNKKNAFFAGESSGHFYFGQVGGAESSIRVILYVLLAMSIEGQPLSAILSKLQSSYESGETNFILNDPKDGKRILEVMSEKYEDGEISWLDGISVDYPTWRFNIRTSNTEPLLRLNVEAVDIETMKKEQTKLLSELIRLGAKKK